MSDAVSEARRLARDPRASASDLKAALKGLLNVVDARGAPSAPKVGQLIANLEGNKGGSYVKVEAGLFEDVVHLEVGHDCVVRFSKPINVWALAAILTQANEDGFENVLSKGCGGDPLPQWGKPW